MMEVGRNTAPAKSPNLTSAALKSSTKKDVKMKVYPQKIMKTKGRKKRPCYVVEKHMVIVFLW